MPPTEIIERFDASWGCCCPVIPFTGTVTLNYFSGAVEIVSAAWRTLYADASLSCAKYDRLDLTFANDDTEDTWAYYFYTHGITPRITVEEFTPYVAESFFTDMNIVMDYIDPADITTLDAITLDPIVSAASGSGTYTHLNKEWRLYWDPDPEPDTAPPPTPTLHTTLDESQTATLTLSGEVAVLTVVYTKKVWQFAGTSPETLNLITDESGTSIWHISPKLDGTLGYVVTLASVVGDAFNHAWANYFDNNGVIKSYSKLSATPPDLTITLETVAELSYYDEHTFTGTAPPSEFGSNLTIDARTTAALTRLYANSVQARHDDPPYGSPVAIAGDANTVTLAVDTKYADLDLTIDTVDGAYKYSEIDTLAYQTESCLSFTNLTADAVAITPTVTRF